MGLADLKKKPISIDSTGTHTVSIEDFINDAQRYAFGEMELSTCQHNIDQADTKRQGSGETLTSLLDSGFVQDDRTKFRHATFSLSEQAITQLSELSQTRHMAKSKILRELIDTEYQSEKLTKKPR